MKVLFKPVGRATYYEVQRSYSLGDSIESEGIVLTDLVASPVKEIQVLEDATSVIYEDGSAVLITH